jgi:hypothetical protein
MLARQALYCLKHTSSPVSSSVIELLVWYKSGTGSKPVTFLPFSQEVITGQLTVTCPD